MGLTSTVAAVAEVPLLFSSSKVLRWLGPTRLLVISFVAYTVRMGLYAVMPDVSWVLGISLLQSLSYCPFLIGSVAYVYDLAPASLKATSQGLLGTLTSLAGLMGSLGGGWLYDHLDRPSMFLVLMTTCLAGLTLFLTGTYFQRARKLKKLRLASEAQRS